MDVGAAARSGRLILLSACLQVSLGALVLADPVYTAVDLGAGSLTYGVNSSGVSTVTGSNGLSFAFSPVQNYLPSQWSKTSIGVPTLPAPSPWSQGAYGNPNFVFSNSYMVYMNSQGLGVGINVAGVAGHLSNSEAFTTQLQPNGTWGPIGGVLWSGATNWDYPALNIGITGVAANGQILGTGQNPGYESVYPVMYLYDPKTQSVTNLSNLINSMKWTTSSQLPPGDSANWNISSVGGQLDNQGRILVQASQGYWGPTQNLLLIPQGVPADPLATPEPATCAIFATLIGGWMAGRWVRSRIRS